MRGGCCGLWRGPASVAQPGAALCASAPLGEVSPLGEVRPDMMLGGQLRCFPLSWGMFSRSQHLRDSLSSHENHILATYLVPTLPQIQITCKSERFCLRKVPTLGRAGWLLSLVTAAMCGQEWQEEEREKGFLSYP